MRGRKGFTLIELMLVVMIIGILAAVVLPRLGNRTQDARLAAAKADIESTITLALQMYELDNGAYPTTKQGLDALLKAPSPAPANWSGPYLKKPPIDPWGNPYRYTSPGTHNKDYDLSSSGPDGIDNNDDDIINWNK